MYHRPYDNEYPSFQTRSHPLSESELPRVVLPAYELPPSYVLPHERASSRDYIADMSPFVNRTVLLSRKRPTDQLGFNIRGGANYNCGIFISKVNENSTADQAGLQMGDQILSVNGEDFTQLPQNEAMRILKQNTDVHLVVKYFPYGFEMSFEKCKG